MGGCRGGARAIATVLVFALLVAAASLSRAATTGTLYLPGAARVTGAAGTNWMTDLAIHNPGDAPVTFGLELLEWDQENGNPQTLTYTLEPGQSVGHADVLRWVFGVDSGAGTIRVSVEDGGAVLATARTYNLLPRGGSYGQFIAAVDAGDAVDAAHHGRLIQLRQSDDPETGHRTNLGLVSATGTPIEVSIALFDRDGTSLGTIDDTLQAYESTQIGNVFARFTSASVWDGFAIVTTSTPGAALIAYASVVDNQTGDPVYIPAWVLPGGAAAADEVTVSLPGDVPLVLVRVPAGTFQMGSPTTEQGHQANETLHEVTLTRDYYLGKYEVTQEQWLAVTGTNPSHFSACGDDCPVENVSWDDVAGPGGFLELLNQHLAATGQVGAGLMRLPTEAEWERAARAGTQSRFAHGDALDCDEATSCAPCEAHADHMWWCANSSNRTHPVGEKQPNGFGLHDMHGNVAERVSDWHDWYPSTPAVDPTGPATGTRHEGRGGSWASSALWSRAAARSSTPEGADIGAGCRVAMTP